MNNIINAVIEFINKHWLMIDLLLLSYILLTLTKTIDIIMDIIIKYKTKE
jgi:hypothetical protein